jgi:AraC-like DNA-binding protein
MPSLAPVGRAGVDRGRVRIGFLMAVPAVLSELGADGKRLSEAFQLDESIFNDPENTIAYRTVGRMFKWCTEATSCPDFGLRVGARASLSSMGVVGYLAQSAPDVQSALEIIGRQHHLTDGGGVATLERDGDHVLFGYEIVEPGVEAADQILAAALAIGFNMVRTLCGTQWEASEVRFACRASTEKTRYRQFFRVPPRFDQEHSAIVFPARWLAHRPAGADALLHRLMRERLDELLAASGSHQDGEADVIRHLRRLLRSLVMTPSCSIETAARRMSMHSRTLKRRLAASGSTFSRVCDEVRFDTACKLLESTRLSAGEVASILGFSEPSSFTRAFQRWTGMSPTKWRGRRGKDVEPNDVRD